MAENGQIPPPILSFSLISFNVLNNIRAFYYILTYKLFVSFSDVADLEKKESILDKLIADCTKSLRELTEGPDNTGYPFPDM